MAEKEPPSNIFDEAARRANKKLPPASIKKSPAPPPEKPVSKSKISDDEIEDIIGKIRKMREEMDKKVESLYVTTGIPATNFEEYFNDPENFDPDLWSRIEGEREAFEEKIGNLAHIEFKKKKLQKKKEKPSKERKGKTLGSRKGWMPMR